MDMENEDHYVDMDRDALFNDHLVVGTDNYAENSLSAQDEVGFAVPNIGMEFKSEDAAKTFYDEYARRVGFSTRVSQFRFCDNDGKTNALEFLCAREGIKKKNSESCYAMLRIEKKYPDMWVVSRFVKEHSHSTVAPRKVHHLRTRTPFPDGTKAMEQPYSGPVGQSLHVPVDGKPKSIERNRVNPRAKTVPPLSITTDSDKVVRSAVPKVFPRTRHRICHWRFLREGQKRFDRLYNNHPTFQGDLYNCINMSETVEEFESLWSFLIDKHHLMKNDWLQGLYDTRELWVPVYFRGTFFASIPADQGSEAAGSFFDGYVDEETTLPVFFRQYERALQRSFEKEIEADLDTMRTSPVLKTPSPMEKQAANLYTRRLFVKFQEELVETFAYTANKEYDDGSFSTYRVAKFEDQQKAYMVSLHIPETRATCSCQLFEYSGILCRHVLTVFTMTNVFTLPSHYINKRWTRHAKSGPGADYRGVEVQGAQYFTSRYNSLCQEALRYAEEGAVAVETYNVAINAIREGGKKVAVAMKDAARVAPKSQVLGNQEDGNKDIHFPESDMTPLLWPNLKVKPQLPFYCPDMTHLPWMSHQKEAAHHSNHKNAGVHTPASGKNIPRLAPLSLQQDDGPPDTTVLPCLRSMTWFMENKDLMPAKRVAVIYFKLQDYSKGSSSDKEVKFQLSKVTLEPMLRSMASISEQLAPPGNQVAVMNLKNAFFRYLDAPFGCQVILGEGSHASSLLHLHDVVVTDNLIRIENLTSLTVGVMCFHAKLCAWSMLQDSGAISGETEVKFQVSRDTLGAILRSMAYIREQLLSTLVETYGNGYVKED
ncbi:hypothetical protein RHSIM_RhsimUnG0247000 [Rhododendron simsii]|uniref:Protein FAR1-RELATED SEQUENCE n=1 Tax=Rhododendron simsii TaxID=118357 RepID=A0A834L3R0_RHOSS|nr:hypothetical protein RHSIM_RhsimUnG0247000 [Rhododendron simsii]